MPAGDGVLTVPLPTGEGPLGVPMRTPGEPEGAGALAAPVCVGPLTPAVGEAPSKPALPLDAIGYGALIWTPGAPVPGLEPLKLPGDPRPTAFGLCTPIVPIACPARPAFETAEIGDWVAEEAVDF